MMDLKFLAESIANQLLLTEMSRVAGISDHIAKFRAKLQRVVDNAQSNALENLGYDSEAYVDDVSPEDLADLTDKRGDAAILYFKNTLNADSILVRDLWNLAAKNSTVSNAMTAYFKMPSNNDLLETLYITLQKAVPDWPDFNYELKSKRGRKTGSVSTNKTGRASGVPLDITRAISAGCCTGYGPGTTSSGKVTAVYSREESEEQFFRFLSANDSPSRKVSNKDFVAALYKFFEDQGLTEGTLILDAFTGSPTRKAASDDLYDYLLQLYTEGIFTTLNPLSLLQAEVSKVAKIRRTGELPVDVIDLNRAIEFSEKYEDLIDTISGVRLAILEDASTSKVRTEKEALNGVAALLAPNGRVIYALNYLKLQYDLRIDME